MSKGYLGFPAIKQEDFNRLSQKYYPTNPVCWVEDKNNPGVIDPNEVRSCREKGDREQYVRNNSPETFTPLFNERYARIVELRRQELVREEVTKTKKKTVQVNLADYDLSDAEHKMIGHILKAGDLMDDLFQMQLGSFKFRDQLMMSGTLADREMMDRYQSPWCRSSTDPLCNGLATFTPDISPMFPEGMKKEEATGVLASPFTVVEEVDVGPGAIFYPSSFPGPKMAEAAKELRKAVGYAEEAGENHFAKYLKSTADAFESNKLYPYGESDQAWNEMKGHSKFYLRIGPDEVGFHPWHQKAGFHMSFGIIDPKAAKSVEAYSTIRQDMEDTFAKVIGPPYKAKKIDVSLPDFVNIVMENGQSRGGTKGTSVGQTLPNWCGEDGKAECTRRTMIFSNKLSNAYSPETMERYGKLLDPDNMKRFNPEGIVRSVVDHEFAHNLGPYESDKLEDGKAINDHLGDYSWKMEELKAQVGSLFLNGWLSTEKGLYDKEKVNQGYTSVVCWMFGHLRRAYSRYKEGTLHEARSPYQLLSAIGIGYLSEKGAITFNEETQKFTIHYEKMPKAVENLLHDVGQLYVKHNKENVVAFYHRYTKGEGLKYVHMDAINRALGDVPSSLFKYEVVGLKL